MGNLIGLKFLIRFFGNSNIIRIFQLLLLLHSGVDEALGEVAVAHEERAVEVGAEHIFVDGALGVVFAVVAMAADDGAEGLFALAEEGAAVVIFKAEVGFAKFVVADLDVADEALEIFLMQGVVRQRAEALYLFTVSGFVILANELIAAADGNADAATLNVFDELVALGRKVFGDDFLLVVLAAADEKKVKIVGDEGILQAHQCCLNLEPFLTGEVLQHEQVAVVAVGVEQISVKMTDAQFHIAMPSLR